MEKQDLGSLIKQAKKSAQKKTIQKIVPITTNETEKIQFSFHLEKPLLKQLKQRALNDDESIKAAITKAINNYLEVD